MTTSKTSSLFCFDMDDTLFTTKGTKVHVMKFGKLVRYLTPAEFNVYKLKRNETFDFIEFRTAKIFAETAKPFGNVFRTAKKIVARFKSPNTKIVVITARPDLDDKELFIKTFAKYGFDIKKIHVYRSGNIPGPSGPAKRQIINGIMKTNHYDVVHMFDDGIANLDAFLSLRAEYPKTKFEAFAITHDGKIVRHGV